MLKASARNSNHLDSETPNCLNSAMSKFVRRGFDNLLRPESPNVNPRGAANAPGLNSNGPGIPSTNLTGGGDWGSPIKSAYDPIPARFATPALSGKFAAFPTLKGTPVCKVVMPENCQPPRTCCAKPVPLEKGRS